LQLGIAAQGLEGNAETRASLVTNLILTPYAGILTGHDDLVAGIAFSPKGKYWPAAATTTRVAAGISLTPLTRSLSANPFRNTRM
jgi:hypothetical protein